MALRTHTYYATLDPHTHRIWLQLSLYMPAHVHMMMMRLRHVTFPHLPLDTALSLWKCTQDPAEPLLPALQVAYLYLTDTERCVALVSHLLDRDEQHPQE